MSHLHHKKTPQLCKSGLTLSNPWHYVGSMKNRSSLSMSLLREVIEGRGSLELQRSLQKKRLADAGQTLEAHLRLIDRPEHAQRGAQLCQQLAQQGIHWVALDEPDYPTHLHEIEDPPVGFFYRGNLSALQAPCVAIIGSRTCTAYGQSVARKFASELARCGLTIVSGLALGIDAHAHQACLEAQGHTAAVLGTGVDAIYPKAHHGLAQAMLAQGGLLLSEFAPGTTPRPFHFPIRNRIISGLCQAVIVVEGEKKSGSLITARHALDQGRDLYAVPGPIDKPSAQGTNYLIQTGAAQLLTCTEEVLESLAPLLQIALKQHKKTSVRIEDAVAKRIYEGLDAFEPRPLEFIVADAALPTQQVMAKLVQLESLNLVIKKPGPYYLRNVVHTQC